MTDSAVMFETWEASMSKGQQRSNREAKKPKKTPAERAKAIAAAVAATAPVPVASREGPKKR